MNAKKSTLSALCLCLMAGSVNAEILAYSGHATQIAEVYGPTVVDTQIGSLTFGANYSNALQAYATELVVVDGVTYDSSASASTSLAMNMDLVGGVFHGWGNYQTFYSGPMIGGTGIVGGGFYFQTTSAYAFTLDFYASQGSHAGLSFHAGVTNPTFSISSEEALDIHESGILLANQEFNFNVGITGASYGFPEGQPTGSFGYTLTLTPVPEPETYAMLLAGLGLVGAAARRRRPARV